ncbi:MAG TPA: hypothetical protein DD990_15370 [Cyanobacteria bacterium UBA11368]|nr:hypothetical protein [Cyanobacteria bacterium UBA11368]
MLESHLESEVITRYSYSHPWLKNLHLTREFRKGEIWLNIEIYDFTNAGKTLFYDRDSLALSAVKLGIARVILITRHGKPFRAPFEVTLD